MMSGGELVGAGTATTPARKTSAGTGGRTRNRRESGDSTHERANIEHLPFGSPCCNGRMS
jgi:hypothetical protein